MKYEDVELKKEKDRDIMGMMPSSLIRISFTILTIIICLLIIVGVHIPEHTRSHFGGVIHPQ